MGVTVKGVADFMASDEWHKQISACGIIVEGEKFPANERARLEIIKRLHVNGFMDPFTYPALRILQTESLCSEIWEGLGPLPQLLDVVHKNMNGYDRQAIIKRITRNDSWCNLMLKKGSTEVGPANIFVSWALLSRVVELNDTLQQWLKSSPDFDENTKFWICDFAFQQNVKGGVKRLPAMVQRIGTTLLYFDTWNSPVPLKRAWCIFEIYYAIVCGGKVEILVTEADSSEMLAALRKSSVLSSLWAIFAALKVEDATSFRPDDREMIFDMINKGPGCKALNVEIVRFFQTWVVNTCTNALQYTDDSELTAVDRMELHTKLGVLLRELGFIKRSAKVLESGRLNAEEDCVLETQAGVQLFV
jgi:hypothetical protein